MWPFKKKQEVKETKVDHTALAIEKFKEFRQIGETFNYLGRTCLVTSHCHYEPWFGLVPELKFEYADNNGVIHHCCAQPSGLPLLIKQQEPAEIERFKAI